MKKLLLTITLSGIVAIQCFARAADTSASLNEKNWYDIYQHQSRVNNTLGGTLVVPGAAIMFSQVVGGIESRDNIFKYSFHSRRSGIFFLGTAMVFRGVPFVISAEKSRHRAYLSLQRRSVLAAERSVSASCSYAAISLKIKF